jgi:hypothetical protein
MLQASQSRADIDTGTRSLFYVHNAGQYQAKVIRPCAHLRGNLVKRESAFAGRTLGVALRLAGSADVLPSLREPARAAFRISFNRAKRRAAVDF